jgi:hypothetical protein
MKPVILSVNHWKQIRKELYTEYPKTVFMLRSKMKSVLGFTVREHKEFFPKMDGGYYELQIHLDFFSQNKRTMFLIKFSDIIGNQDGEL